MRTVSWALGWTLAKAVKAKPRAVAVVSNLVALGAFVLFLYFNLMPGEPIDWAAVLFGLVVFAIYAVIDFYWAPWARGARTQGLDGS